jgi:hypothetical protein
MANVERIGHLSDLYMIVFDMITRQGRRMPAIPGLMYG